MQLRKALSISVIHLFPYNLVHKRHLYMMYCCRVYLPVLGIHEAYNEIVKSLQLNRLYSIY